MITDQTYGAAVSARYCIAEIELISPVVALCASLLLGDPARADVVAWILNQVKSELDALTDQAAIDAQRLVQTLKVEVARQGFDDKSEPDYDAC